MQLNPFAKGSQLTFIDFKDLSSEQRDLLNQPIEGSHFLEGPAGAGKTTVGIWRLFQLIEDGVLPSSVLVLVPQRRLARPYTEQLIHSPTAHGMPETLTMAGIARRMVELFWPMFAERAGFQKPNEPPRFLTLETAQYHLSRIVGPYLDEGYFESLSLDRYRLYRQILDNLNKAAVVGFPVSEIGVRLSEAWIGPEDQTRIYMQAQTVAEKFRAACYEKNLVDFSLQYELLMNYVEPIPQFRQYFSERFTHLIVDNIEEETPQGHDFIIRWLPEFESTLVIGDVGGGYSRFLGAAPEHSEVVRNACDRRTSMDGSFVMSKPIQHFAEAIQSSLQQKEIRSSRDFEEAIIVQSLDYLTELISWVVQEIRALIDAQTSPHEIAIVSPFVSDSLRFLLTHKLEQAQIGWVSHRPSRAIADEAFNRCLLTIAALAHPSWNIAPLKESVAHGLMLAIENLDLIRATLIASTLYRTKDKLSELSAFDQLRPEMQERIGFLNGERFEILRSWIYQSRNSSVEHLDHFISRLFGEVLSQPGFGFHNRMDAGRSTAAMIASIQKFRAVADIPDHTQNELGREYYRLIQEGLLAAQYLVEHEQTDKEAIFIAPAFTYLTMDKHSDIQFWLDIGSQAWAERLYQPLTHPYVLSRNWKRGKKWNDEDEWNVRRDIAATLTTGLSRRCRKRIYLCHSMYGEQGLQEQGILLRAIQRVLSEHIKPEGSDGL